MIHLEVLAKDFKAFVADVKANPGVLNFGSAGNANADATTDCGSPAECSAFIKRELRKRKVLVTRANIRAD